MTTNRITRALMALLLLMTMGLPLEGVVLPSRQMGHGIVPTAYHRRPVRRRVVRRRSRKKSAAIIGGSALGGAAIGALAGGKKGAAIGAAAGAGGGYVYDRKTQHKPVIPK